MYIYSIYLNIGFIYRTNTMNIYVYIGTMHLCLCVILVLWIVSMWKFNKQIFWCTFKVSCKIGKFNTNVLMIIFIMIICLTFKTSRPDVSIERHWHMFNTLTFKIASSCRYLPCLFSFYYGEYVFINT